MVVVHEMNLSEVGPLNSSLRVCNKYITMNNEQFISEGSKNPSRSPASAGFQQMLDASTGNFTQRMLKRYIRQQDPVASMRLMEAIHVDDFQKFIAWSNKLIRRTHKSRPRLSNYTITDQSSKSLVDFATYQTVVNELYHLAYTPVIITYALWGNPDKFTLLSAGVLIGNSYCVLLQRYNRARLSITIDRRLRRDKRLNLDKYKNYLGLNLHDN